MFPRRTLLKSVAAVTLGAAAPSATALELPAGYTAWRRGPSAAPDYFPIGVWLQDPRNAERYRAAGINLYVGLWKGPTYEQLDQLKAAGLRVVCDQNAVGLERIEDPTIAAWMHGDEPDNAQAKPGGGYGGPIPFLKIQEDYEAIRRKDPSRPVMLNLGQGVANDEWKGRAARVEDYPAYCKGADIVSFDVYPVAGIQKPDGENYLWWVPKGVDRLRSWTGGKKPIWTCIECSKISAGRKASPEQVRAEVWMALIRGARGLIYFVHQFRPNFVEASLLEDPALLKAVTQLNSEIRALAPVLNGSEEPMPDPVSRDTAVPVSAMARRVGKSIHVFAVGMRNAGASAEITLPQGVRAREVIEVGSGRRLVVKDQRFSDDFPPYAMRHYTAPVG